MPSVGKDVEKQKSRCFAGNNVTLQPLYKQIWQFLKSLNIKLP